MQYSSTFPTRKGLVPSPDFANGSPEREVKWLSKQALFRTYLHESAKTDDVSGARQRDVSLHSNRGSSCPSSHHRAKVQATPARLKIVLTPCPVPPDPSLLAMSLTLPRRLMCRQPHPRSALRMQKPRWVGQQTKKSSPTDGCLIVLGQ